MIGPLSIPRRLNEVLPWFNAIAAYDYDDPKPLAALIRSEPIPPEFKDAIANIVSGNRCPNRKAAVKMKIPAAERMDVAEAISVLIGLYKILLRDSERLEKIADRQGKEHIEIIRQLQLLQRKSVENFAEKIGVSVETVENLLRDFRTRVARWSIV